MRSASVQVGLQGVLKHGRSALLALDDCVSAGHIGVVADHLESGPRFLARQYPESRASGLKSRRASDAALDHGGNRLSLGQGGTRLP